MICTKLHGNPSKPSQDEECQAEGWPLNTPPSTAYKEIDITSAGMCNLQLTECAPLIFFASHEPSPEKGKIFFFISPTHQP